MENREYRAGNNITFSHGNWDSLFTHGTVVRKYPSISQISTL